VRHTIRTVGAIGRTWFHQSYDDRASVDLRSPRETSSVKGLISDRRRGVERFALGLLGPPRVTAGAAAAGGAESGRGPDRNAGGGALWFGGLSDPADLACAKASGNCSVALKGGRKRYRTL
jgi:hypothetical protein